MISIIVGIILIIVAYILLYGLLYQTPEEKAREDRDQMEYLKNLAEKKRRKNNGNTSKRTRNSN